MPERKRAALFDCTIGAWLWASNCDRLDFMSAQYVNCPVKVVGVGKDSIWIKFVEPGIRRGLMLEVSLKNIKTDAGYLYIALPGEIARSVEEEKRRVADLQGNLQSYTHLLCTAPTT